ncbi:hypothetical protein ScPMuIL_007571 [Solemya velum]
MMWPNKTGRYATVVQIILTLWNAAVAGSEMYMESYGLCTDQKIYYVDGDSYTIYSGSGENSYSFSSSSCTARFETQREDRLCLIFRRFSIKDCHIKLEIYFGNSPSGALAEKFSCRDNPESICSSNRFLTLQLKKDSTRNVDYDFELEIRERTYSDAFTEGIDAFILSIGVIIAIIVGVLVVIAVLAVIVVYCCCKRQQVSGRMTRHSRKTSSTYVSTTRLEPSAPPLITNSGRLNEDGIPSCYISEQEPLSDFHPMELPPPYSPSPPPYVEQHIP